jgi:hypothetical protein
MTVGATTEIPTCHGAYKIPITHSLRGILDVWGSKYGVCSHEHRFTKRECDVQCVQQSNS